MSTASVAIGTEDIDGINRSLNMVIEEKINCIYELMQLMYTKF